MPTTYDMEAQDEFERGKIYRAQLRRKFIIDFIKTTLVLWAIGLLVLLCLVIYVV